MGVSIPLPPGGKIAFRAVADSTPDTMTAAMLDTRHPSPPLSFALYTLATWRITHLLVEEDGPADAVLRARRIAGEGAFGQLMDCFYCMSIWVALPLAAGYARERAKRAPSERSGPSRKISQGGVVSWLALSGAACLLEQATRSEDAHPLGEEQPEGPP
jgi:hypothetical protein